MHVSRKEGLKLYDLTGQAFALGSLAIIVVVGLASIIAPKSMTKEEFRNSDTAISATRKKGIVMTILGIVLGTAWFLISMM